MAAKKKGRRSNRRYVSVLSVGGMLAAASYFVDVRGVPGAANLADGIRGGVVNPIVGKNAPNILKAIVAVTVPAMASSLIGGIAPQSKIPIGRYGIKP